MNTIKIKQSPCGCSAYAFPHRANSGSCQAPGAEPKSCSDCKFSSQESDPYGTGDKTFYQSNCQLGSCAWSK